MSNLAENLANVKPRTFVTLKGHPKNGESRWHVNNAVQFQTKGTTQYAIVLQNESGEEEWIVAIVEENGTGYSIEELTLFEEEPDSLMDASDEGVELSPSNLKFVDE